MAYTRLILSRVRAAIPPEPASFIARAFHAPGDGVPELPDFARMTTLHALDVLARSGWLLEEPAELSWVRDHGADFVQGFLLGKPAPVLRS